MNAAVPRLMAAISVAVAVFAHAATNVNPADVPMSNTPDPDVKPTVMFIMDDSGSMAWDYMPDSVGSKSGSNCYRNYHFNRVYYNPTETYVPPVHADGTSYGNATYPGASQDGFLGGGTTDLSSWYYYNYTGTTPTVPVDDVCYGNSSYTKVNFSSLTAAQKQNVANWYAYYRTRILMMKSAITLAFKGVDDRFRIGYMSINNNTHSDFLNPATFDATGKAAWYAKIVAAKASSGTGTRWALATVGRLFGGKLNGQNFWGTTVTDPIKYSCQQNMAILSTDGFWNSQMTGMGCSYNQGCYLDGTQMGDTDSALAAPFKDAYSASGTLADIANYYYSTDLRPDITNNVFPTPSAYAELDDHNKFQHMNTSTIGLGVNGTLKYKYPYWTCTTSDTDCDYGKIKAGTVNWPSPVADNPKAIDDLWHAAVNGHGRYFGASDPTTVKQGLSEIVAGFPLPGAGGAAATGSLVSTRADGLYLGSFATIDWTGDLQKFPIDESATPSASPVWSAQTQLDGQVSSTTDSRTIYIAGEDGKSLVPFISANLTSAIANNWFEAGPTNPNGQLSQYPFFTTDQQTETSSPNTKNLINFLRGQRGLEDAGNNLDETSTAKVFRGRKHVLGDIVNSAPIYLGKAALFDYQDAGYQTFVDSKVAARTPTVYVGANDGMLHAFDAASGRERWAFVPTAVLPYLYKLADKNYSSSTLHRYFVDGPLSVGDVDFGTSGAPDWHTVLIGGLGKGGKAFYALDVTGDTPILLWEFSAADATGHCVGTHSTSTCDKDLGYTFGNVKIPRINLNNDTTKDSSVAVFASGYDNTAPGDSNGHLYVLDIKTGELQEKIPAGSDADPSLTGMAWINGWNADEMHQNYVRQVYAGDLGGRVWRFDLKDHTGTLMTTLGHSPGKGDGGVTKAQPVTTQIELSDFGNDVKQRVLYVGTGRYLSYDDVKNKDIQSIYAIRDTESSTTYPIGGKTYFRDTPATYLLTSASDNRTSATFDYSDVTTNAYGWYMDFNAAPGERVMTHPRFFGVSHSNLTVETNVPAANACDIGGTGYVYRLNAQAASGTKVATADTVYEYSGAMIVGVTGITTPSGEDKLVIVGSDGKLVVIGNPPVTYGNTIRRMSWRELRN